MIGTIQFSLAGEQVSATMDDEGRWECANPAAAAVLNAKFRCDPRDYSPAHGEYGWKQLSEAAAFFGGLVTERAPVEPAPEGAIH